jgi:nucleotide-binding universal stress UspA family protein
MERSIVCGVDDSDAGRSALGTADWLAARLDARLIALHTIDPDTGRDRRPRSIAGAAELAAAAEESALHVLEETVKEVEPIRKPDRAPRLLRRLRRADQVLRPALGSRAA